MSFRMYIRVVSDALMPVDISNLLGVDPDEAHAIGSRKRPEYPPRSHTSWIREVESPVPGARPEDFTPVLLSWGDDFATALRGLTGREAATVSLVIVQEIRDIDSSAEKGIFLGAGLLAWLARAGAAIDIDQYIHHD
ncbi:DUF4279 domain-containing protein [Streptomyces klenkii]|uniref:DUF4279 domain-containing protein n=1 Tax=Streptomyces klenkii TaxID=1420899 RepID=UPI0033A163A8